LRGVVVQPVQIEAMAFTLARIFDAVPGALALHWLIFLACEDPARARNPPGTVARQADRLQSLLG